MADEEISSQNEIDRHHHQFKYFPSSSRRSHCSHASSIGHRNDATYPNDTRAGHVFRFKTVYGASTAKSFRRFELRPRPSHSDGQTQTHRLGRKRPAQSPP